MYYKQYIKAYFKYVDHSLVLFKGTNRQLKIIVYNLNKYNKNIYFKPGTHKDNKIIFLDLIIIISNN